jgi:hypothetical protein
MGSALFQSKRILDFGLRAKNWTAAAAAAAATSKYIMSHPWIIITRMRDDHNHAAAVLLLVSLVFLRTALVLTETYCVFPIDIQDCTAFADAIRNETHALVSDLPQ